MKDKSSLENPIVLLLTIIVLISVIVISLSQYKPSPDSGGIEENTPIKPIPSYTPVNITPKEVNEPPSAVVLDNPFNITETSMKLTWSNNSDSDFKRYELYGSKIDGFSPTADTMITSLHGKSSTSFTVEGLTKNTIYYFCVRVLDLAGLYNDSNQAGARTLPPHAPKAVILSQTTAIGQTTVSLQWTRNNDADFMRYEVAGSTQKGFTISSYNTFTYLNDPDLTNYSVTGLPSNTTFYFKIRTTNGDELYNDSNEVNATTLITAPPPIISIRIYYSGSWSGSILDDTGSRSVDGTGNASFVMSGGIIVAVVQKDDDSGNILTVQILKGDNVVETQSTNASYGVVSVSHNFE